MLVEQERFWYKARATKYGMNHGRVKGRGNKVFVKMMDVLNARDVNDVQNYHRENVPLFFFNLL
jgi:hypothetical protein